jgi:hypothetical protein
VIIIDVEIKKAILGRNETPLPDIEYCGGWRDFAGMGISCVCTYDIVTHLSRVFLEEDLGELFGYLRDKPTAGFNTKRFDIPLLAHHWLALGTVKDRDSIGSPHYDILEQIWLALGLNPDKFNPRTHGGWGLDAVCQATLGIAKIGHGALAPVWWQQGKCGKVIDYCLNDVWMEGSLLLHIINNHSITRDPNGCPISVLPPQVVFAEPARSGEDIVNKLLRENAETNARLPDFEPPEICKAVPIREGTTICKGCKRVPSLCVCTTGGLGIIR